MASMYSKSMIMYEPSIFDYFFAIFTATVSTETTKVLPSSRKMLRIPNLPSNKQYRVGCKYRHGKMMQHIAKLVFSTSTQLGIRHHHDRSNDLVKTPNSDLIIGVQ